MKHIILAASFILAPFGSFAATPSTSCPTGYITIVAEHITIADTTCPNGYISAGTATGCLMSTPAGSCLMYAPSNTEYTDTTGSYKFTAACPLE